MSGSHPHGKFPRFFGPRSALSGVRQRLETRTYHLGVRGRDLGVDDVVNSSGERKRFDRDLNAFGTPEVVGTKQRGSDRCSSCTSINPSLAELFFYLLLILKGL